MKKILAALLCSWCAFVWAQTAEELLNEGSYGTFTVQVRSGRVLAQAYWRTESDTEPRYTRWKWRQ